MDDTTTIQEVKDRVKKFVDDRDWDQFHTPKDLAIAISVEAAELLEIFRFKTDEDVAKMLKDPKIRAAVEDEAADMLHATCRFAQKCNIDLAEAFSRKIEQSEKKYPIEKAKGVNKKYTEL